MATEDDLYTLPLEEFTAARNALAKDLAKAGDSAASAEVKRLTKPTRTAWALNQVARGSGHDVERLLEAGARVREAQERALAGDASGLHAATRAEQEMIDPLVSAGLSVLGRDAAAGGTAADRLRNTLRVAATDPETGGLLREGRLVADVEPSGFGLDGLSAVSAVDAAPAPRDAVGQSRSASEARAARRELEQLRRKVETARARAERLVREADRAERQAEQARAQATEAEAAAAEAERAVHQAEAAAEPLD